MEKMNSAFDHQTIIHTSIMYVHEQRYGGEGSRAHKAFSRLMRENPNYFADPSSPAAKDAVHECLYKFTKGYNADFSYCGSSCAFYGCSCSLTDMTIDPALDAARIAIKLGQYKYARILLDAYTGKASSLQSIAETTVHKVLDILIRPLQVPLDLSEFFRYVQDRVRECPTTSAYLANYQHATE
jgi:hypothetical protein